MDHSSDNPPGNDLGPGVTEEQLVAAVKKSGYPLQTMVVKLLTPSFWVQEEWCYIDRDTKELRTIDVHANMCLHEWDPQPHVRPSLTLLVECKQSSLPYVFFPMNSRPSLIDHPKVYGLHTRHVVVSTDDDTSQWPVSIVEALGLMLDDFQQAPLYCSTFSRSVRKASNLELSGTEAYAALVLPLIKALEHFETAEAPPDTAAYFDAYLTVALAVLDAPIVSVSVDSEVSRLTLVPWVRVVRHEYGEDASYFGRNCLWTIDIVHREFLQRYLNQHLLPFAQRFAEGVLRHPTELATGHGFASGKNANWYKDLEARLRPRKVSPRLIAWNLARRFIGWHRGEKDNA